MFFIKNNFLKFSRKKKYRNALMYIYHGVNCIHDFDLKYFYDYMLPVIHLFVQSYLVYPNRINSLIFKDLDEKIFHRKLLLL